MGKQKRNRKEKTKDETKEKTNNNGKNNKRLNKGRAGGIGQNLIERNADNNIDTIYKLETFKVKLLTL